ncbi:MAG: 50S ribosome-binding GTPase [Clostridia bacterium]|nr:50S ribosome-binding GTPase [Clostridia bacterium]
MSRNIYELLEKEISEANISESEKNKRLSKLLKARGQKINLILVGATGSGKSSTINSLFDTSVAKVGIGVDPETTDISCYELENLTIWDSPGLGDSNANDANYSNQILKKLSETDDEGVPVVDLVLVVIDASTKDLKTTCGLINDILLPALTMENADRILIAVNQADMAMKGNHWLKEENRPDDILKAFLEEKCDSISNRISEETGVEFKTMYYCAGYTDENGNQMPAYNLTKLLYNIVISVPAEKRIAIAENLNGDNDMWEYDDGDEDYISVISQSFGEVIMDTVSSFAEKGVVYGGALLGMPGALAGSLLCGAAGAVVGLFKGLFE